MTYALPILLVAIIVLMFVQMSRQRKSLRRIQELQASLAPGDRVMTTSGLHATVVAAGEGTVTLEVAPGVRTVWDTRVIRERVDPEGAGEPTRDGGA